MSQVLTGQRHDWSTAVSAITAPTLIIIGDADSVRPAHAVEMFELLGGGKVDGGKGGVPNSQLFVLPSTTHLDVMTRTDWLLSVMTPFLDAPVPEET